MEIDRVKLAIIDQLKRFDEYSKKIAIAKEAATMDPGEKARLQAEFSETENRISNLEHEIAVEERATYNILSENPGKLKLLEKQSDKIARLKASVNENEEKIGVIISKLEKVQDKEKIAKEIGTIQAAYKQCLASLMNLRNRFPESYDEAEQESGIYFLTTPKLGKQP